MRILFVYRHLDTFTEIDLKLLQSKHEVRTYHIRSRNPWRLASTWRKLDEQVRWSDAVFAWFGGFHALIPFSLAKRYGRRTVVVASGYDVAAMHDISYGNLRPGLRRQMGKRVFSLADRILAVSQFTAHEVVRNAGVSPEKVTLLYHGLPTVEDEGVWPLKQQQVLTVGKVYRNNLVRKGLMDFVRVGAAMPTVPFLLVGPHQDGAVNELQKIAAPNVQILGPRYGEELVDIMRRSKVYLQLSAYESFGMAVAEAMQRECIPVVSDRGALPEVVGKCGYQTPFGDINATSMSVRMALEERHASGRECRTRINKEFDLAIRREKLLAAMKEMEPVHAQ